MYYTYDGCTNLTGSPVCGPNVVSMPGAYRNCSNLTGSPVCGNYVTEMSYTYDGCTNLTGSPVCGPNVVQMYNTYRNCHNLTGSPICGDKVTIMINTYYNCQNLTGSPVCGDKVTNMYRAYYNCRNLTGSPICGPNVTNMSQTYHNCTNLAENAYFYSERINDSYACFYNRNTSRILRLYVKNNSTTLTSALQTASYYSLVGSTISWTDDLATNGCYYNTKYNIYIYPIDGDMENFRINNEYNEENKFNIEPNEYIDINNDTVSIKTKYKYAHTELAIDIGYVYTIGIDAKQLLDISIKEAGVK